MIDDAIRELVAKLEATADTGVYAEHLHELIGRLRAASQRSEIKARYEAYRENNAGKPNHYPIDADGYAVAYDPLTDEEGFWNAWSTHGIVVGKSIIDAQLAKRAIERMHAIVLALSDGRCNLDDPKTWDALPEDADGTSLVSRGFFEIYHDTILAELRQSIRAYIHHVLIWGRVDLWTSFDRLGAKLPGVADSRALPLHVDQNPLIHSNFKTVQGVLALADCSLKRGTFAGVPGSVGSFLEYKRFAPDRGEYVELPKEDSLTRTLEKNLQAFPMRAGDLVSWDSRTAHANTENVSDQVRYVAYIAAGPAREDEPELLNARTEAFKTGLGSNVREALMHASKKSRYTNPDAIAKIREPEHLTPLGKLLYGQTSYGKF